MGIWRKNKGVQTEIWGSEGESQAELMSKSQHGRRTGQPTWKSSGPGGQACCRARAAHWGHCWLPGLLGLWNPWTHRGVQRWAFGAP